MINIRLCIREKIFIVEKNILMKFRYFRKILKKYNFNKDIDLSNRKIDLDPNEFREVMKYAKDPTYKLKKKYQKGLLKLGFIDEYDEIMDELKKESSFVGKVVDSNSLFNFFKFIEKTDTALLKSQNNKLILNIINRDVSSFTNSILLLDRYYGTINKPLCINHKKLCIINKLSKNPVLLYLQDNQLQLFTKAEQTEINWNMCLENVDEEFEEPLDINYKYGFRTPAGSFNNIVKMDKKIEFIISDDKIKLSCGSITVSIKEKCNEKYKVVYKTKDMIDFLKNIPIKDNVKVFIKKKYPLLISYKNNKQTINGFFSE